MLKLDGARRAASSICSRVCGGILMGSKTLTALLLKIASRMGLIIVTSMLLLQHTYVAVATLNFAKGRPCRQAGVVRWNAYSQRSAMIGSTQVARRAGM